MFNNTLMASVVVTLSLFVGTPSAAADGPQQTLYFGGDIITMEGDEPTYVEAVVERDGKTLLPGFIEPHAHPVSIGAFILANDIVAPHEWRMARSGSRAGGA